MKLFFIYLGLQGAFAVASFLLAGPHPAEAAALAVLSIGAFVKLHGVMKKMRDDFYKDLNS